jgi:hypothetical protein
MEAWMGAAEALAARAVGLARTALAPPVEEMVAGIEPIRSRPASERGATRAPLQVRSIEWLAEKQNMLEPMHGWAGIEVQSNQLVA